MTQKPHMQYGVIRSKLEVANEHFTLDGEYCPECHKPTEVGHDPTRRYCINKKCNALIMEEQ